MTSPSTPDVALRSLASAVSRLAAQTRDRVRTGVTHDDADDEVGTAATDDAIGFNPVPLLRALGGHGARVVVIGQVAGIMHGSRELTGDLDLLSQYWAMDRTDRVNSAAAEAAREFNFVIEHKPDARKLLNTKLDKGIKQAGVTAKAVIALTAGASNGASDS